MMGFRFAACRQNFHLPTNLPLHQQPMRTPGIRSGFTLVEILIVVVIIGIALSLALANLFPDEREQLREESERIYTVLQAVRDESALGGRAIAVRLNDNQLEFLERDPHAVETVWQPAQAQGLKARPLAAGIAMELASGGRALGKDQVITFLPTGIGTPFTLTLSNARDKRTIEGDPLGNLAMKVRDGQS